MDLQCSIAGSLEKPQPDDDAVANNNDAAATATTTTTLLDNTHGEVIKSVDEVLECGGGDVVPEVEEDMKPAEDEKSQNVKKVFHQIFLSLKMKIKKAQFGALIKLSSIFPIPLPLKTCKKSCIFTLIPLFLHKSIEGGVQDVVMKDEDLKVEVRPEEGESKTTTRFQMDHDGLCMRAPPSVVSL